MVKADIARDGVFAATEIGHSIYAWTRTQGRPSSTACVISAHGAESRINSSTPASGLSANTMVFFYGPHGYTLKDPGVYGITTRTIPWLEKCVANRLAQDYELTKFQGRHGKGGETYEFIGKTMHPGHYEAYIEKMFPNPVFRADAMKQVAGKSVEMDVITIRNRRVFSNPTLFSLILALQNRGFSYREIHCSFCRGGLGDANPPSWDYKFNE